MSNSPDLRKLNPCPDCEHLCSLLADSCPNCGRPFSPQNRNQREDLGDTLFEHILNHSSTMVGICLTLLTLVKVVEGVKSVSYVTDEFLAVDALGFLLSSILTYLTLKISDNERKQRVKRIAHLVFAGALVFLAVICGILAIELFS